MAERACEDKSARDRIETGAPDRSMVVLAGAGAGQTTELVELTRIYMLTSHSHH